MGVVKYLSLKFVCALVFFVASPAFSQTWVCDARAATGFDRDRGYQSRNFNVSGISYRIIGNIRPEQLSLSMDRENRVFDGATDRIPAGLQLIGDSHTALCIESSLDDETFGFHHINCDSAIYGRFKFNLETGRYTRMDTGFESNYSSQSWVEVGECRRIN